MEIWIGRNGERHGPYEEEDVRAWLRSGQVSGSDLAWREGLADWQPLSVLYPDAMPEAGHTAGGSYPPPAAPSPGLPQTTAAALEDYAGLWKRVAAYIIDTILLYTVIKVTGAPFGMSAADSAAQATLKQAMLSGMDFTQAYGHYYAAMANYNLAATVVAWLYFAICESSAWQGTVGKLALGIRVTDLQGRRISFLRALGRYGAKFISAIIVFIGFVMVAFTRQKQGLHDMICGTLVLNGRASEFKDAPAKSTANGGSFTA